MMDNRIAAVLRHVSIEETIELSRALVRIPSITGTEGRAISQYVLGWLNDNGLQAGEQIISDDRANVWARVEGTSPGPRLLINGHLDTKPVTNMTVDPFSAEILDGRLYGRGACDMKSAVAAAMIATRAVVLSGIPIKGTLLFGAEVGEEGGGWRLIDLVEGPCQCDQIICCEPTDLEAHLGARGGFPIEVSTRGLATHTGMAYRGINAIQKMATVIEAMYAMPCFHHVDPVWGRSPINAQEIRGGGKVSSSVADDCTVIFDIRLNPDLPPSRLKAELEALFAKLKADDSQLDLAYTFRGLGRGVGMAGEGGLAATATPPENPLIVAVVTGAEEATGVRPPIGGFPGGCSAGVLQRRGIDGVIIGPGNLEQAHGAIEWIEVEQIGRAARIYAAAIARALAP